MSEHNPTNPNFPKLGASPAGRKLSCEEWEALLVDFLDGALPATASDTFQSHRDTCAACAEMFAQSGQGREWLNFLKVEPQVPSILISKILAQTSGAESIPTLSVEFAPAAVVVIPVAPVVPFWKRTSVAGSRIAQPRLLMTAAMAFFSITLTLNMAGVRLSAIHAADLKPSSLSSNLNRQFYSASARVVRYYDNLRFFYEMEARVRELRRDADLENSAPAGVQSAPSTAPQDGGHKNGGKSQVPSGAEEPRAMLWGEKVEAALINPVGELQAQPGHHETPQQYFESTTQDTDSRAADQVERGIA